MNEATLEERTKRILQINEIIKKLDPSIRPAAFVLLQEYVLVGIAKEQTNAFAAPEDIGDGDREGFFSKFTHDKPADNALLISAYHYGQYGAIPFIIDEIKTIATDVGLTIPERVDMTFGQAQRDGKNLFFRVGGGVFRPTVHGEVFLKKTYQVSKGKKQKQKNPE